MLTPSSKILERRTSDAETIQKLVENNQLDLATKKLMDFVADFGTNKVKKTEVIEIRRRFIEIRNDKLRFPEQDFSHKTSTLAYQILEIVELIQQSSELPISPLIDIDNLSHEIPHNNSEKSSQVNNLKPHSSLSKTNLEQEEEVFKRDYRKKIQHSSIDYEYANTVFLGQDLTKNYKSKSLEFNLYISEFELKFGEITAVVGENGNGKTTLLRIIRSDLALTTGYIRYPALDKERKRDLYKIKQQIAYIPLKLKKYTMNQPSILLTLHTVPSL